MIDKTNQPDPRQAGDRGVGGGLDVLADQAEQTEEQGRADTAAQDPTQGAESPPAKPDPQAEQAEEQGRADTAAQDPTQGAESPPAKPDPQAEQAEEQGRADTAAQDPTQGAESPPAKPDPQAEQAEEQGRADTAAQDPTQGGDRQDPAESQDAGPIREVMEALSQLKEHDEAFTDACSKAIGTINTLADNRTALQNRIDRTIANFKHTHETAIEHAWERLDAFLKRLLVSLDSEEAKAHRKEAQDAFLSLADTHWQTCDKSLREKFQKYEDNLDSELAGLTERTQQRLLSINDELIVATAKVARQIQKAAGWDARFSWLRPVSFGAMGFILAQALGGIIWLVLYWIG